MTLKHFDDLTAIDCPFGELDADTIGRLVRAWMDGEAPAIQYQTHDGVWEAIFQPSWEEDLTYRLAPRPLTKPSVDWTSVGAMWNAMATEYSGTTWLHARKPQWSDGRWIGGRGGLIATNYASFVPGTCDWRDSLVMRPGYEGE